MSLIKDVIHELKELDVSKKSLLKFGMTVGGIFLILALWFFYKDIFVTGIIIFTVVGGFLFIFGIVHPNLLRGIYKVWMGLAFTLGWIVSRIILTILFIVILTPVSLIAMAAGKKFMDTDFRVKKDSYWIKKENDKINYEKMY